MRGKALIVTACLLIALCLWNETAPQDELRLVVMNRGHFVVLWVESNGQPLIDEEFLAALDVVVTVPGGEAIPVYNSEGRYWALVPHGIEPSDMSFTVKGRLHESYVELSSTPRKPLYVYR